jgi:nucleoside-diphosphate-sugar epimerase
VTSTKKVLITGATGFIGRCCLPLLVSKGYEVHAVRCNSDEVTEKGVVWHQADLLDSSQVSALVTRVRPSHLLHFAWITTPREFWGSLQNIRWVQSTLHLLETFAANGGERVVIAGSCAEYDWKFHRCSEFETPLAPATLYGASKHAVQCLLQAFAWRVKLSAAWGRMFFLYGPNEHPNRLVAYVIRKLLQGEQAFCPTGDRIRDFLYVHDIADAFVMLLNSDISGPVNIASGQAVTVKDLVLKIAQLLERPELVQFGSLSSPHDEPEALVADVNRLRFELGWSQRWSLVEGLEETISWWRDHLQPPGSI